MLESNCSVAIGEKIRKTESEGETAWVVVIPFIISSKPQMILSKA